MKKLIEMPQDPYSPEWALFWGQNPDMHKSVGAEAAAAAAEDLGEGEGEQGGAEGEQSDGEQGGAEGEQGAASKDDLDAALQDQDWRSDIKDDDLKKTAERFTSKEDALRAIQDFRKRDSQIRVPGKDASDEAVAAYHKAIGVPETAADYKFAELPKGELTDEIKASREAWSAKFHELKIPQESVTKLSEFMNEVGENFKQSQVDADKAFVDSQEEALKDEWKGEDFDKNKTLANRAFNTMATQSGVSIDELQNMETKEGRFIMDDARILRMFAAVGREMDEGTLGPALSDTERDTVEEQVTEVRQQIAEAQADGNTKKANKLYEKEQALVAKMSGNRPVVGAGGRSA